MLLYNHFSLLLYYISTVEILLCQSSRLRPFGPLKCLWLGSNLSNEEFQTHNYWSVQDQALQQSHHWQVYKRERHGTAEEWCSITREITFQLSMRDHSAGDKIILGQLDSRLRQHKSIDYWSIWVSPAQCSIARHWTAHSTGLTREKPCGLV